MIAARSIRIQGIVQGVGFRPYIYRLARTHSLAGWVLNEQDGIQVHLEGSRAGLQAFLAALQVEAPAAAGIHNVKVTATEPLGLADFEIRESRCGKQPTAGISPDLSVCGECLNELLQHTDRRFRYPYINCTNCGPRYSVIEALPYDRPHTTMRAWPLDDFCLSQYEDPADRRFHAQPVACPSCGPHYFLRTTGPVEHPGDWESIQKTAGLLRSGRIVALKGLGGYHLACDATQPEAVARLRERKFRKEKPFALMGRNLDVLMRFVEFSAADRELIASPARPIVLAPARAELAGIAPDHNELGVMLPYTPLHHLLFEANAPELLVMTSANRSSEPIAYKDDDALQRLAGLADAFLIGERPIARRVDDSVVRNSALGPVILRRSRGYAPAAVTRLPIDRPVLAVGADLKSAVTLVVDGQAFVSQHIGDLDQSGAFEAFQQTIEDLLSMYQVDRRDLLIVSDLHPQYFSTTQAQALQAAEYHTIQHHRAHIASVPAERQAWSERLVGVAFDGTGYGDDGSIWGGEFLLGSVESGFERVAHLRPALLAGGDAAARNPVQASAGFLEQLGDNPDFSAAPFDFPPLFFKALQLVAGEMRTFPTTSMGRLFDSVAALTGFTRAVTFEGQAAMWLEYQALGKEIAAYPFPFSGGELDFRPLLKAVIQDRLGGRAAGEIARAFHNGIARGVADAVAVLCSTHNAEICVLSGGVFQNGLLPGEIASLLRERQIKVWINHRVPAGDGGISLGQAALAAFGRFDDAASATVQGRNQSYA